MKDKQLSFFGSAFYYTLGVILAQGVTFLTLMILPRLMTTDGYYTNVSLYSMWGTVFATLIGLEAASSLNNARFKFGAKNLDSYASSLLGIGLIMLGIFAALFLIFQEFFTAVLGFPLRILFDCLLQGFFTFTLALIAQKCRVTNKPLQFVVWTSLVCILRFALSMAFVTHMQANQYLGDIYASVLAYVIVGGIAAVVLLRSGKSVGNKVYWRYCLFLTVPIVFHTLASLILGRSDLYMLNRLSTPLQSDIYSFVYNIGMVANAVWLAFNNAWSVWYFDKTAENKNAEILNLYRKYAGFVTLLTVAVMLVAPDVVRWFGGEKYAVGQTIIPVIMMGCFFMFLYTFPVAYETYKNKTVYIAIGTTAAAAVNIILNFTFIPLWGALGAALTSCISYGVLFVFHYVAARFIIRDFQIGFSHLLLPALLMLGIVALTYAAMDITALRWIVAIAALVFSFFVYRKSRDIMM